LDLVTARPARLMRRDYGVVAGAAADLVVLDCVSRRQAVAEIAPVVWRVQARAKDGGGVCGAVGGMRRVSAEGARPLHRFAVPSPRYAGEDQLEVGFVGEGEGKKIAV
jgi:cytosine/adenosine deaminase-related metal-dependent hydrolase